MPEEGGELVDLSLVDGDLWVLALDPAKRDTVVDLALGDLAVV